MVNDDGCTDNHHGAGKATDVRQALPARRVGFAGVPSLSKLCSGGCFIQMFIMSQAIDIYVLVEQALLCCPPQEKVKRVQALYQSWKTGQMKRDEKAPLYKLMDAGRPELPVLVHPSKVPRRSLSSNEGHAAMVHAIAHIEFNAINLALDAAWRFRDMPDDFVSDWLRVAYEEAYHFGLVEARLHELGYQYGDFLAHDGLWTMTHKTDHDPMVRMALVPRVLEARGLDATPGIQKKLAGKGDHSTCAILDIILRDEIGHVKVGNYWFTWLCDQRGIDPLVTFRQLLTEYDLNQYRGPYNRLARYEAGFTEYELKMLEDFAVERDKDKVDVKC